MNMLEQIQERISVLATYDRNKGQLFHKLKWNGRVYEISKTGYHHKVREGRNIQHVFHISNSSLAFKIKLDSETLSWWLLEVSDGN